MAKILKGSQLAGEPGPTVLVVDDEELVRTFLTRVLGGAGYRVISASSGEEAMAILASTAIDLVVTDIRMPGMDGRDLGVLISQLPLAPPVIYASASDNPPAGGHYIQKPFPGSALVRMAQEVISRRSTERAGL